MGLNATAAERRGCTGLCAAPTHMNVSRWVSCHKCNNFVVHAWVTRLHVKILVETINPPAQQLTS